MTDESVDLLLYTIDPIVYVLQMTSMKVGGDIDLEEHVFGCNTVGVFHSVVHSVLLLGEHLFILETAVH